MNVGDACKIDDLKEFDVFRDNYPAGKNDWMIIGTEAILIINTRERYDMDEFDGEKLLYLGSLVHPLEVIRATASILIGD